MGRQPVRPAPRRAVAADPRLARLAIRLLDDLRRRPHPRLLLDSDRHLRPHPSNATTRKLLAAHPRIRPRRCALVPSRPLDQLRQRKHSRLRVSLEFQTLPRHAHHLLTSAHHHQPQHPARHPHLGHHRVAVAHRDRPQHARSASPVVARRAPPVSPHPLLGRRIRLSASSLRGSLRRSFRGFPAKAFPEKSSA
jgi:hypothetical protein